jgi:hypothetical protein
MQIEHCLVTNSTATILKPYIDNVKSYQYRKYKGYHTGIDIKTQEPRCVCIGVVTYIGQNTDEGKIVVIQYTHDISFRYTNLISVQVNVGDTLTQYDLVGYCKDHVHFECISLTAKSNWTVKVGDRTYCKIDPTGYVDNSYQYDLIYQYPIFKEIGDIYFSAEYLKENNLIEIGGDESVQNSSETR